MDERVPLFLVSVLILFGVAVVAGPYLPGLVGLDSYGNATVTVSNESGALATVDARVADSPQERYDGLSGTDPLENGTGMLFVFPDESNVSFVMRGMTYPLDIVYIGADGRITTIHTASVPPEGTSESDLERYPGRAKWVLEVPAGWAERYDVTVGDRIDIQRGA